MLIKKKSEVYFLILELQIEEKVFLHRPSAIDPSSPVRSRLPVNFLTYL